MQDDQIEALEAELRSVIADAGLQWVLDEVDRSVADGLPQERILRRRRRARAEPMEDEYSKAYVAGRPLIASRFKAKHSMIREFERTYRADHRPVLKWRKSWRVLNESLTNDHPIRIGRRVKARAAWRDQ